MAQTIERTEAQPDSYTKPNYLVPFQSALQHRLAAWHRIEAWIAHRWAVRDVVYLAEGPGEWVPDLVPTTIITQERWDGEAWATAAPAVTPLGGFMLEGEKPYRFTGTAGDGTTPPPDVEEAHRRLTNYLAQPVQGAQYTRMSSGALSLSRSEGWAAKAMQLSGAADLLRPYRRLGR